MITDAYLDKFAELVLEYFMFDIHPLVVEPKDVKNLVKFDLRKHMFEYNQKGKVESTDRINKAKVSMEMVAKLSNYFLTAKVTLGESSEEVDAAYMACTRAFASTRSMLQEYENQVLRRLGYM